MGSKRETADETIMRQMCNTPEDRILYILESHGLNFVEFPPMPSEGFAALRKELASLSAPPEPTGWSRELRPEVVAFARLMEERLRANDHKGGWKHMSWSALLGRLRQETHELDEAARGFKDSVGYEAADVANFAMMVADVCEALPIPPQQCSPSEPTGWMEAAAAILDRAQFLLLNRKYSAAQTALTKLRTHFAKHAPSADVPEERDHAIDELMRCGVPSAPADVPEDVAECAEKIVALMFEAVAVRDGVTKFIDQTAARKPVAALIQALLTRAKADAREECAKLCDAKAVWLKDKARTQSQFNRREREEDIRPTRHAATACGELAALIRSPSPEEG